MHIQRNWRIGGTTIMDLLHLQECLWRSSESRTRPCGMCLLKKFFVKRKKKIRKNKNQPNSNSWCLLWTSNWCTLSLKQSLRELSVWRSLLIPETTKNMILPLRINLRSIALKLRIEKTGISKRISKRQRCWAWARRLMRPFFLNSRLSWECKQRIRCMRRNLLLMKTSKLLSGLRMFLLTLESVTASQIKSCWRVWTHKQTRIWSSRQESPKVNLAVSSSLAKTKSSSLRQWQTLISMHSCVLWNPTF